nr:immunoglobulin light chain junction region [Macaca mulatta]
DYYCSSYTGSNIYIF